MQNYGLNISSLCNIQFSNRRESHIILNSNFILFGYKIQTFSPKGTPIATEHAPNESLLQPGLEESFNFATLFDRPWSGLL
jgi:hypothetical protein